MANLTIVVDDTVLKHARIRAIEQGTSVNAVLHEYLVQYAGIREQRENAAQDLLKLSRNSSSRRGGRRWTRDDLYER